MSRFVKLTLALLIVLASAGGALAQDAPFTILADEELKPALELLYGALYDGAAPAFVAARAEADLLATADAMALAADAYIRRPVYFLYGAGLGAVTENVEAAAFMDFVKSPGAQKLLIDGGLLPAEVTITDQGGNEVVVSQPVERILSPYAMASYYIYTVGGGDRIVAANFLGMSGPAAEAMARIDPDFAAKGSFMQMSQKEINIEEAAAQEPDLITASTRTAWIDAIRELGVPLVLYEGETPEALKEAMFITGQYLGPDAAGRAEAWAKYYDWVFGVVTEATSGIDEADRVKVLFTGTEPLRVASGEMYQTAMVEAAGGISVSAELTGYWNDVNLEQVVVWNPDVIFLPTYGGASVEAITESAEWQVLDAVKAGHVYQLPQFSAPLDTPVPDSVLGIIWMAHTLYPDLLGENMQCKVEAPYFYATWYGYAMSDEEITAFCGE
ncbi:MAG: ABC transporter substrate-binding protein [Anaerolineae bacterium]|nr:ABC transporter substrate-binding protein [Anaerolineae bacterium]